MERERGRRIRGRKKEREGGERGEGGIVEIVESERGREIMEEGEIRDGEKEVR